MNLSIDLNDRETKLRLLLLDVAKYAERLDGHAVPELRFAGGWVRDKLLGFSSEDIDIAINNMTGVRFGHLMKDYLEKGEARDKYTKNPLGTLAEIEANPEKSKHLETVTTKIFGLEIDLVNLRKETYSDSSRNPSMEFGSPEEDAMRRDSTINALFYNLSSKSIEDFSGRGIEDLKLGIIKTPLDPLQTFRDDPLRILRAIRFASRFDFEVDRNDFTAMKDKSVKSMLQTKISRERIGTELIKMLKGPNPSKALALIDELGLYGTVFTENPTVEFSEPSIKLWSKSYGTLQDILGSHDPTFASPHISNLKTLKTLLIRDPSEAFHAWLLTCFTPWARIAQDRRPSSGKRTSTPASSAAKEGLKADNKICKIIDDATHSLDQVILHKNSSNGETCASKVLPKQPSDPTNRERWGMAIRRWGANWRFNVIFAVLTEAAESRDERMRIEVLNQWTIWLREIEGLDLLNADKIKPIANGKELLEAIGVRETGPWVKRALDVMIAWQFRHPHNLDMSDALKEIVARKQEIGMPD